jgi:hypothetical protein
MVPKVTPIVTVAGTDASSFITPNLLHLTYKEGIGHDGGATAMGDTVDLSFADPHGQFRRSWSANTAAEFNLTLQVGNFTRQIGKMQLKSIRISQSKHRGTVIHLSATSIPVDSHVRLTKKSQAWEKTDLKTIASQIAQHNKLKLNYLPKDNPTIERADQHDHSDAFMLSKLASEHDYRMKIVNGTLTIRDSKDIESAPSVGTFICPAPNNPGGLGGKGIIDWEYQDSLEDVYTQSTVSYKDPKTGTTTQAMSSDVKIQHDAPHLVYHYNQHPGPQKEGEKITLF